ncbi:MAG: cache domain-containing protein [Spirochaetes bacterium]|nr:cache domain-containing protein [Spirochaetota bacterium]
MNRAPVRVELHCHSNLSDGAAAPETLAAAIAEARISFASLTDHNTMEGCGRFRDALSGTGVACIDGVEISTISGRDEVHLLGYGANPLHPALRSALAANRLHVDPGMPGLVDSLKRMGSRSQRPGAAPLDAAEAISLVHAAGGRAFIAHPLSGPLGRDALVRLLPALVAAGLDGLEAIYGPYTDEDRRWLEGVAAKHRLVVSGGSDFHGPELVAGPEPGVELTGAQWKAFRDLLLPGRRPVDRLRSARAARRPALGRFAARIVLPAALAVVLFVIALFAVAIPRFERVLLERKKEMIRELANEATSILREYSAEEQAGRLSAAEARRGAADRVRDLRYGKDGKDYFWITDMKPVMIVHPYRPELEGTDVSEYRDANGVQVFVEFVKAVRDRNQGYVEYLWQWKDDSHRIVPKLSFVERFPAWDWVVGTGIYLDDVQAEIVRMARLMIWLSLGITTALALLLAFVTHQSLAIERGRQSAEVRLRESHERYRALVEASGEGMVLLVDGAFTYANRTFLDMTGYSASQLPLVGVTELIHPHEGDEQALERFLATLAPGAASDAAGPPPLACRLARRDGDPVDAVLAASPFAVAGRHGWILAARDAGIRYPADPDARAGDSPYHAVVEGAPFGLFQAEWGRRAPITEASPAARRMLGLGSDPRGEDLFTRLGDADTADRLHADLAAGASVNRRELRIARAGAEELAVLLSAALGPVRLDGSRRIEGILEDVTAARRADDILERIVSDIGNATTMAEIAAIRGRLPDLVQHLLESGAGPAIINRRLTRVSNTTTERLVHLAGIELGSPPAAFVFMALGSEGREEQTLGSDQDSAIVFAGDASGDPDAIHEWFHSLGLRVCGWLEGMGVPPCVGGIMASNPRWCAPISDWEAMFGRWIAEPEPRELLDFQVFFDFRPVHGDRELATRLRRFISERLGGEPPFFLHLARDALQRRLPPLFEGGILRDLLRAGSSLLDTKDALIPFVSFARLYALRHGVEATNTLARLDGLRERGVLKPSFHADIAGAYTFLAGVRLARQAASMRAGKKPDDILDTQKLDREGKSMLHHAAAQAVLIQKRISFDFLGSAL